MKNNYEKRLTSLAVFRSLYESKKDIYYILEVFINDIIQKKHLIKFTSTEIKNLIKEEYGFNSIPEGVISTTIKRTYKKQNGTFVLNQEQIEKISSNYETLPKADEIHTGNNVIINSLVNYIESKLNIQLSQQEKEVIIQSLCEFIIGGSVTKYEEYIGAFILSKQDDLVFTQRLNTIKEGVVLYSGIQYNDNVNELGSWQTKLTLYLEQELIFQLAGYDGLLYKQMFDDFYSLVVQINKSATKPLIKLMYFKDVENNIDLFFKIAERIVEGKEQLDYSKNAMYNIVKGCKSKSDVLTKKAELLCLLKEKGICLDEKHSYYNNVEDHAYNIESEDLINQFANELPNTTTKKIEQSLKFLSYINVKRKGLNNNGFNKIGHILLSANTTTLRIAFDKRIKTNGDVPLSTYLDYITNKFWFTLNKGFGDSNYPKTFDIITRAQVILSAKLSLSVSKEFEELEQKRKSGELTDEVAREALILIRQQAKFPEDLNCNNVENILKSIEINDLERLISENELEKEKAKEQFEINKTLSDSLTHERNEKNRAKEIIQEKKQENKNLLLEVSETKKSELEHIDNQITKIKNRQKKADRIINRRIKIITWIPAFILLIYIIILALYVFLWSSWTVMEPIVSFVTPLLLLIQYLFFAIKGRSFNPMKFIKVDYKNKIAIEIYEDRDVSLEELDNLISRKKTLESVCNQSEGA